ncbi:hypothetical protein MCBRY_000510 [Methylocystis bryophila]
MSGKFKPTTIVVDSPVCIGNWCPHNFGGSYAGSLPLANALARSLNTVAVKLSIAIGNGNPKMGRAKIVETARALGITAPLTDTPSLPIGACELTVLEHSAAYAAFVNGGKRTTPYTAVEISNRRGDVLYKHDRDAPKQVQAVPLDKVIELGSMMHKVVLEGTGRAADLGPGIDVIGKTGTTNGFKDAWFCGYSGTMGGCIWYGNDDGELMNNMTGGSLPAHTWHDVMAYAHEGVQLKPIVGMTSSAVQTASKDAGAGKTADVGNLQRPASLSKGAAEALSAIAAKAKNLPLGKGASIMEPALPAARAAAENVRPGGGAIE